MKWMLISRDESRKGKINVGKEGIELYKNLTEEEKHMDRNKIKDA